MKRVGILVFGLLFLFSAAMAGNGILSPVQPKTLKVRPMTLTEVKDAPLNSPGFEPVAGELDEIVGDTVIVGFTYWESQHNGTVGRMVGYSADDSTVSMDWTCEESAGGARHVRFNRVDFRSGTPVVEFTANGGGNVVDNSTRAGYTTLGMEPTGTHAFPNYHFVNGANTDVRVAAELDVFPGIFNESMIPPYGDTDHIWPKGTYGEYDGTGYLHVVTHEYRAEPADPMQILYSRQVYDPVTDHFEVADAQQLVTDNGMNISADVAVSDDGARVAIVQTISRDYLYWPEDDASQWNNDVYLWISEDGGETWDWDNPINVTDFAMPNADLLPDTLAADVDTFRTYTDANVYIDHNNVVHVAFTTPGYFHFEGTITYTSNIYHWDEETATTTKIADGQFWNYTIPGAWQLIVERPSMYQDPVTGILWCVFTQMGMPDENTYIDETNFYGWDGSDDGYANGEVMITASPPSNALGDWYGHLWTAPINLTNTRGDETNVDGLAAGDCRNEREPSIALNNDGDYLNIFYVLDLDAGFIQQDEGEYTNNPVVLHRVSKDSLMALIEAGVWIRNEDNTDSTRWLPNYPLHIDTETGYWEDPYGYAWESEDWGEGAEFWRTPNSVNEDDDAMAGEFALEQNYPNPFNPSTRIAFSLRNFSTVKLAVYDVLGREVAVLVNRTMEPGQHSVIFNAEDLSSGVYFVKLSSGDVVKTRKMVLMK